MSSSSKAAVAGRRSEPVARLHELHADDGGAQRDEGEFAQDAWRFDLAVLDAETLALEGAEELLDQPAAAVVGDASMRGLDAVDGSAGEEPPVHRLDALRGIELAHVEGIKLDTVGQLAIDALAGPAQPDRPIAQDHVGPAGGTARDRRQVEDEAIGDRQGIDGFLRDGGSRVRTGLTGDPPAPHHEHGRRCR